MMTKKPSMSIATPQWAALLLLLLPLAPARAQSKPSTPAKDQPKTSAPAKAAKTEAASAPAAQPAAPTTAESSRAQAYYHAGLASIYEDQAITEGRIDEVTRAIEEYKLALNADPGSPSLSIALANLYFRAGRTHDAEVAARSLLKTSPDFIDAHKLLGRIYLRQLGEGQTSAAQSTGGSNVLDQAIAEYEKLVSLDAKSVEDRMVLGQLYTVKHNPEKAEEQFKSAQTLEPESEEVVLNLSRLYAESGNFAHAVKALEAVPADGRTPKMEMALGALYDQMKQPKDAIAAYKRAASLGPSDLQSADALAQSLMNDNQLDEALKLYQNIAEADPENGEAWGRIGEIQRRQGKYSEALDSIRKARKLDPKALESGFNEGMLLDIMGRLDEAASVYQQMVDVTAHANGAYTTEEKNNRSIFLERLGSVDVELNKIDSAVAAYQKMVDLGGSVAVRGYQGQVDAYRTAHQFDKSLDVARKAVAASPKDRDLKLMLAGELADQNKPDEAAAMAKSLLDGASPEEQRGVWCAIAQMDIRLRRWKEAEEALAKADPLATKKEDRVYVLFLKGELAERQKHLGPAEQFFRQVLEIDPDNAMTLNYLGYMWADKSTNLPEALKMIRRAVEVEPMSGAYLDSLGWVYFKMGEYELAEDNLRKAVSRTATDPTVHMHLGDLYEKTGRIRLAAAQWELMLSEAAKSSSADFDPADVSRVQKKLEGARVKLAKEEHRDQVKP